MGTYIIHFDDKPWEDLDDEQYYRCKEIPWFSTTKTTISRLTPYTEPDLEQVRIEAYQEGKKQAKVQAELDVCHDIEKVSKENYKAGLSDAWEAARKIKNLPEAEKFEIFGEYDMFHIMRRYTATEAIEKIRQYEQEKEEQIQVGDEVRSIHHGWTAVVSAIYRECMTLMDTNGELGDGYDVNRFTKTGRHFPEIAEVLQKMKETDNG